MSVKLAGQWDNLEKVYVTDIYNQWFINNIS